MRKYTNNVQINLDANYMQFKCSWKWQMSINTISLYLKSYFHPSNVNVLNAWACSEVVSSVFRAARSGLHMWPQQSGRVPRSRINVCICSALLFSFNYGQMRQLWDKAQLVYMATSVTTWRCRCLYHVNTERSCVKDN